MSFYEVDVGSWAVNIYRQAGLIPGRIPLSSSKRPCHASKSLSCICESWELTRDCPFQLVVMGVEGTSWHLTKELVQLSPSRIVNWLGRIFFFPAHALSSSVGPRVLGPSKSLPLQWPQTARRAQLGAGREKGWVVVSVL